jgi:hypothetical protein
MSSTACYTVGECTGRANEGEVGWVEEHYRPFAFQVSVGHVYEVAVFVCGSFERFYLAVDDRHR